MARRRSAALLVTILANGIFLAYYWPLDEVDIHSPGVMFNGFIIASTLLNLPFVWRGGSLALNRSELVLVYIMLLVVSALCTMGMSQQLLPALTALFYYASPQNEWLETLVPHFPKHRLLVDDGNHNQAFYEGISGDASISYQAWLEPLCWWAIFLLALYVATISAAVILRRQWVERERLPYPLAQVGMAKVSAEKEGQLVNGLFRKKSLWYGAAIPLLVGTLKALNRYDVGIPLINLDWNIVEVGNQRLNLGIHFSMVGFSYLINTQVAAGIWFFHLLSKLETEALQLSGIYSRQNFEYSVQDHAFLAYQGGGALIAMVLLGFWIGRQHLRNVFSKAFGRAPEIDDSDEIMSYRSAVAGLLGGSAVMAGWLWLMGTKLWVALLFVGVALLIFIGLTRVLAEAGLAAIRAPLIAPDLVVQGLGSQLVGTTGVFNLSLTYIWCGDVRIFLMAVVANGLKLIEEMDLKSRRYIFWGIILALFIGSVGSCWMVFHLVHIHGGINLDGWRFKAGPEAIFNTAVRTLGQEDIYWPGLGFFFGGGIFMLLLAWARQRLLWWPFHPLGFPVGANMLMGQIWFSVFIAWAIKKIVLRFGGAARYQGSQIFFLGLILGEVLCTGLWIVIDFFTGKTGNTIFGIG